MPTKMQAMIAEQPEALRRFLAAEVDLTQLEARVEACAIRKVWIIGSGTSLFAAMIAASHWERHLDVDAEAISSLEFLESVPDRELGTNAAVIGISQSGASFILVEGLRRARAAGAITVGVTAEPEALIGAAAEFIVPTFTGPETAMGKTKGFTTTALAACWLATRLGSSGGASSALAAFPASVARVIGEVEADVDRWVDLCVGAEALFAVGSGELLPSAWEGGLKVLEVAKQVLVTKELEEMLHGPFNAVGPTSAFILLAGHVSRRDRLDAFLDAVATLERPMLIINDARTPVAGGRGRMIYTLPALGEPALEAILAVVPLQIFADRLAKARDLDGDTSRYPHLYKILAAKSIYV